MSYFLYTARDKFTVSDRKKYALADDFPCIQKLFFMMGCIYVIHSQINFTLNELLQEDCLPIIIDLLKLRVQTKEDLLGNFKYVLPTEVCCLQDKLLCGNTVRVASMFVFIVFLLLLYAPFDFPIHLFEVKYK